MSFMCAAPTPELYSDEGVSKIFDLSLRSFLYDVECRQKAVGTGSSGATDTPSRARHLRRRKNSREGSLCSDAKPRIDAFFILCSRKEHGDRGRLMFTHQSFL